VLLAVYSFSVDLRATRNSAITGDEPFYLLTTQSLLADGDFDLRSQFASESYREFFDHPGGLWQQSLPLNDGRVVSPHEPGTSLLVLPGFAAGGLAGAQWTMLLVAAATFAATYVLVALETKAHLLSWLVTAAVALSATGFVYSTEIYPEVPAALCIVLSLLLLRRERLDGLTALVLVALLTLLAWFGVKYVFLGGILALHFLWRAPRMAQLWFLGLSTISGLAYGALHLLIFDHLVAYSVNTVYEGASSAGVLQQHLSFEDRAYRLWGLFIDERFGLARWAPLFLPVWPGLPSLLNKGRVGITVTTLILAQILIATFVAVTMMGFWFPGRTLMVVLPLFALVLTNLALRVPSTRLLIAALGLGSLAITAALYRSVHDAPYRLAVDPFDMQAWPFRAIAFLFPDYRAWDGETVLLTLVWLALFLATAAWLRNREFGPVLQRARLRPTSGSSRPATGGRLGAANPS
jgi:hypothetical protein